jgi:hypothetical protein
LKNSVKIAVLGILLTTSFLCSSQTEQGLLPYSSNLLINPSFAGLNKSSSVWSNLQFFAESRRRIDYSFSITYDSWSEKLKAGTAWYFYQGLKGEVNTNYVGAGFTFSKPYYLKKSEIVPSININYFLYTKQWLVHVLDGFLDLEQDEFGNFLYQPPGEKFMLHDKFTPRIGLLWNSPELTLGISASRHHTVKNSSVTPEHYFVVHASQKTRGKHKGLESKPFKASPELVVLASKNLLLSRVGFRMDRVDRLMAFFVQNNFTENTHGIAGILGWKSDNLNISLTAGGAYSLRSNRPSLFGELSFGFVVPYQFLNMEDPWAPPDKSY